MKTRLIGLLLAAATGLLVTALRTRASVAPMSREALVSAFDSSIRNLVVEWDPGDPRPDAERRKALFGFISRPTNRQHGFRSPCSTPNLITQAVVGDVDTIVGEKVGSCVAGQHGSFPRLACPGRRFAFLREPRPSDGPSTVGLSHRGDRRRGVLRCGHQNVRRALVGEALKR